MFRYLRLKCRTEKLVIDPGRSAIQWLSQDECLPATLRQINSLPEGAKRRIYHALLPPELPTFFDIDPVTWKGRGNFELVLRADVQNGMVNLSIQTRDDPVEEVFCLQLSDNPLNRIDLDFIVVSDPRSPRFGADRDETGRPTLFGTAGRNLQEEQRAMSAGLAPGQVRRGLSFSKSILQHVEAFLASCGHSAYFLEPLTYSTAWLFEKRGFAYVQGHKLMDDIHRLFQPENTLFKALDGSTLFRNPQQWSSVRGRAWAIHDGILEVIDRKWDKLRMVKRIGCDAGVETFPGATY